MSRSKTMRHALSTVFLTGLALTVIPTQAHALFGGGVNCASPIQVSNAHRDTRGVIRQEHETTRDAIIEAIETEIRNQTEELDEKLEEITQRLIETLILQTKEASSYTDKHIEAQRRFADAQEMNATDRMRQQVRAEAESGRFDPNPFVCAALDNYASSRSSGAAVTGQAITQRTTQRLRGNDEDVAAGGVRVARSVVDARDQYAGFNGSDNPTTDWGIILNEPTLDTSDGDTQAIASWIIGNSIDPMPAPPITDEELNTPEGMSMAAARQRTLARQSAAIELTNMSLNMRSPVLADATGQYQEMANDSAYNRPVPDVISELQQLDIRTVYHYAPGEGRILGTGGEANGLVHMNEKGWLREIHEVMSINARVNFLRLELENRNAIVNALILASINQN